MVADYLGTSILGQPRPGIFIDRLAGADMAYDGSANCSSNPEAIRMVRKRGKGVGPVKAQQ